MPGFSEAKSAGFVLAALLVDDRALTRVRARLSHEDAGRVDTLASQIADADKASSIARLLVFVRPRLSTLSPALPTRLRALLARQLPAEAARALLSSAPLARAGFEPPRDLLPRLLRIARRSIEPGESP